MTDRQCHTPSNSQELRVHRGLYHRIGEKTQRAVHRQKPTATWTLRSGAFEESAGVYRENLRSMLSLLKVRDLAAITVNQPARLWVMSEDDIHAQTTLGVEHFRALRSLRDTLKVESHEMTQHFGQHYTFVDLDRVSDVPELFLDDAIHFKEAGNRAVAQKIADTIVMTRIAEAC